MIKCIIVDDEVQNINYLEVLLNEVAKDIIIAGKAESALEAINLIDKIQPGIVFLDIQLMGGTGFEVLNKVKNRNFSVVFTTAHEKYAIKAIKFAAIDYLLKPIDKIELIEAINKVRLIKNNEAHKNISTFLENIEDAGKQRIAISTQTSIIVITLSDIVYLEAEGPYTKFHLINSDKPVKSSKSLKEYDELLSDQHFFRTHKSFLVNIKEVKEYLRADGGKLLLSNKATIDVSDKRKDDLMNILSGNTHFLK